MVTSTASSSVSTVFLYTPLCIFLTTLSAVNNLLPSIVFLIDAVSPLTSPTAMLTFPTSTFTSAIASFTSVKSASSESGKPLTLSLTPSSVVCTPLTRFLIKFNNPHVIGSAIYRAPFSASIVDCMTGFRCLTIDNRCHIDCSITIFRFTYDRCHACRYRTILAKRNRDRERAGVFRYLHCPRVAVGIHQLINRLCFSIQLVPIIVEHLCDIKRILRICDRICFI